MVREVAPAVLAHRILLAQPHVQAHPVQATENVVREILALQRTPRWRSVAMERWLSKSRVLLGLCALMLIAAFKRRDPMAYGVFLFLAVICTLGYLLPWLSLRGMQLRWLGQEAPQVT